MALWQPAIDQPIGSNEYLGRRLFDEPLLAGAQDQEPFPGLDLNHFLEKRDGEVSLDRLGQSGVDRRVVNYLRPMAGNAGGRFRPPKRFDGWSVLKAHHLSNPRRGDAASVVPSPLPGPEPEANIYHAHVEPGSNNPFQMALHLRHLFTAYGTINKFTAHMQSETRWMRFLSWFASWGMLHRKSR
jgi:hypothetical protein